MMAAMRQALQEAVAPLAQAQTSSSSTKGDGPDPAQLIAAMQQSMREAMKEAVAPLAQAAAAKEQGPDAAALAAAMRQAVQEAVAPLAQAASAKDQGPDPAQMMAAMQQSMREAMKEAIEPLAKAQSKGGKTKGDSLDAGQLTSAMQDAVKEAVAPLAKAQHETAAAQNVEAGTESQIAEAMRQLLGAFQASQTQQEEKLGAMASAATRAAEAAEAALNASREQRASVAEPADTRGRNIAPLPQHGDESNAAVTQVSSAALAALDDAGGGGASHKLSGAMTFETLTPSRANEFALKAAQAIAKSPDSGYNPFFVGGKVGLGKTHLVTAIANAARSANPDLRLAMFPASRFAGDLAECSLGERDERRESLAALDLLILDDVQYLAERADAQEELFHILNAMSDGGRQVVLAADRAPERLPGFSDRLLSRFAGGLSVTLKPPEYAARRAILQRLAKEAKAKIDDEVLALIATRVSQDVRRMCGALKKVIAFAQLQGEAVGYDVADEIINQMSDIEAA
jgi:chromosomal replication initiator protein DnaA